MNGFSFDYYLSVGANDEATDRGPGGGVGRESYVQGIPGFRKQTAGPRFGAPTGSTMSSQRPLARSNAQTKAAATKTLRQNSVARWVTALGQTPSPTRLMGIPPSIQRGKNADRATCVLSGTLTISTPLGQAAPKPPCALHCSSNDEATDSGPERDVGRESNVQAIPAVRKQSAGPLFGAPAGSVIHGSSTRITILHLHALVQLHQPAGISTATIKPPCLGNAGIRVIREIRGQHNSRVRSRGKHSNSPNDRTERQPPRRHNARDCRLPDRTTEVRDSRTAKRGGCSLQ
jgi:hypothetical protein